MFVENDMLETHSYVALTHADERSTTDLRFQVAHSPTDDVAANRDVVEQVLELCDSLLGLDCFSVENTLVTGAGEKTQRWEMRRQGTLMEWARREMLRIFGGAVCSMVEGYSQHVPANTDSRFACVSGRIYDRHVKEYSAELRLRCVMSGQLRYEDFVHYTSQFAWQNDCLQLNCGYSDAFVAIEGVSQGFSPGRQETLTRDFIGKVAAIHFSQ